MTQTTRTYTLEQKAHFAAQYLVRHKLVTAREEPDQNNPGKNNTIIEFNASHFDNADNLDKIIFPATALWAIENALTNPNNRQHLECLYTQITRQDSTELKTHKQKSTEVVDNTSSDKSNAKYIFQKYSKKASKLIAITKQGGNLTGFLEAAYLLYATLQKKKTTSDARENFAHLLAYYISDNSEIQRQYLELFKLIDALVIKPNTPILGAKDLDKLTEKINEHISRYPSLLLQFSDVAPTKTSEGISRQQLRSALASCVITNNNKEEMITAQSLEALDLYDEINGDQQYFITQGERLELCTKLFQQKIQSHSLLPRTRESEKLFIAFKKEELRAANKPNKQWTRDLVTLWEDGHHHLSKYNYSEEGIGAHLGTQEIIRTFCDFFDTEKETPQDKKTQCLKSYEIFVHDFLGALENTTKSSDKKNKISTHDLSKLDGKTLGSYYLFHTKLKYDFSKKPQQADEIIRKLISATTNYYASRNQLHKIDLPMLSRLAHGLKKQPPKEILSSADWQSEPNKIPSIDSEETVPGRYSPASSVNSDKTEDLNAQSKSDTNNRPSISSNDDKSIQEQLSKLEQKLTNFYEDHDSKNTNLPQATAFVSNAISISNVTDKIGQLYHAGNIIKARLDNTKLFSLSGATTRGITFFGCYKTQRQKVYEALKPLTELNHGATQKQLLKILEHVNTELNKALGVNNKEVDPPLKGHGWPLF